MDFNYSLVALCFDGGGPGGGSAMEIASLVWIAAVWLGLNTLLLALAVGFGRGRPKAADMDRAELDRAA
jgi:hypothetical protein